MLDEETTESTEQPQTEDSSPDQPIVSPEGETSEEPQPVEPTQEEPTVELDGEQVLLSQVKEWKQGHMRQEDYTKKTQELANLKRETSAPKQDLSDEDKQIQDFIRKNKIMTADQFNQQIADNNEIMSLKTKGMDVKQESVVKSLSRSTGLTSMGVPYTQASMTEIYEDIFSQADKPKVVSKKVVGVSPKSGVKTGGNKLTRESIAAMGTEEYAKRKTEILKAMTDGTL